MATVARGHPVALPQSGLGGSRTVMLVTLASTPFDTTAVSFAVDAALESGLVLMVVNVVERLLTPGGSGLICDASDEQAAVVASLRAPAELAHALGAEVRRLRVHSPRPAAALLELVLERDPMLVVFGPDPKKLSRFRGLSRRGYKHVRGRLESKTRCLLWCPQ
jgi:hypothetical protein